MCKTSHFTVDSHFNDRVSAMETGRLSHTMACRRRRRVIAGLISVVAGGSQLQEISALSLNRRHVASTPQICYAHCKPALHARKSSTRSKVSPGGGISSSLSEEVEEVKPLTSAPIERRLGALEALTEQQRNRGDQNLFADMDASAMLLETFLKANNVDQGSEGKSEEQSFGVTQKRLGSVLGATSITYMKKRAAKETLIDKLDERIKKRSAEDNAEESDYDQPIPKKRNRGRPRKYSLPDEKLQSDSKPKSKQVAKKSTKVIGKMKLSSNSNIAKSCTKKKESSFKSTNKGSAKSYTKSNVIVNKQRRVVKSLPKSRRDKNGNIIRKSKSERDYSPGRGASSDSFNLNRYYRTELLTAKEEYSLGMKVKFMVACESVHEGLSLQLGRNPTIVEWAAACGFDTYDANYVDTDLDRQIRPSGSMSDELDPNMFIGNGLVHDTGVGRGKGRAKAAPLTSLGKWYDDSYDKFKPKSDVEQSLNEDDKDEDEIDVFLYRQKSAPGEPINRGSPRIFREMMLTAKEAKQRMIQSNMRLVVSIARRYHGVGVNVQDLVQEGSIGLARAAVKFDPERGFKFSTYASWWIQQAVFRSIAYHSRTIRLPVHVHNLLNKVRRARNVSQQELGRMPTNEEMAEEMDMPCAKYNTMIRNTRKTMSLECPKYQNNPKDYGHESDVLIGDMVDTTAVIFDEKSPEQNVDQGLFHNDIQYMLGKIGDDEKRVLSLRYGIDDGIKRTVTLVASEMGQTKSWVRSQECRALRKLRRPWYEKRLKEHQYSLQSSVGLLI